MSTPTLNDPVARAAIAVDEAARHVIALNRRLAAGDAMVTGEELARAEAELRVAQRRFAVAEGEAAALADHARQKEIATIRRMLATVLAPTILAEERTKLTAAIDAWFGFCAHYDQTLMNVFDALSRDGFEAEFSELLIAEGVHYRLAPAHSAIEEATAAAVRAHYGRQAPLDLLQVPEGADHHQVA